MKHIAIIILIPFALFIFGLMFWVASRKERRRNAEMMRELKHQRAMEEAVRNSGDIRAALIKYGDLNQ